MRRFAPIVWLAILAFVVASCGTRVDRAAYMAELKAGGGYVDTGGYAAGDDPGTGVVDPGAPIDSGSGGGLNPGTGPSTGPSGQPSTVYRGPKVSTKIQGNVVTVGMHVPETGAAPLPTNYKDTLDAIVKYFNTEGKVFGRTLRFVLEDDGYDPQVALAACRKLAGEEPLYVIGHTMPAGQEVCARLFEDRGIPYLMRGTYPEILKGRQLSWFGTCPDDIQGRLLADYVLKHLNGVGKKAAVVFQDDQVSSRDNFVARIKAGGGKIVLVDQSVPRQSDYAATVQKLQDAGAEFVLLSLPPVDAIKLSVQAQGQGYHPTWLGGGTWWNYNMVLESAGMALDGSIVLSPWASIDSAATDEFKQVMRKYAPDITPDDIGLIMWGWANLVREAMVQAGPQLSRDSFVRALNKLRYSKPYWVPISYTATNHRGANSVAVFRADGQAKRWRQISGFVTGF
ncbi:MAG: ABC transporter substrate-binding protein [Actinomycetota bacterium]